MLLKTSVDIKTTVPFWPGLAWLSLAKTELLLCCQREVRHNLMCHPVYLYQMGGGVQKFKTFAGFICTCPLKERPRESEWGSRIWPTDQLSSQNSSRLRKGAMKLQCCMMVRRIVQKCPIVRGSSSCSAIWCLGYKRPPTQRARIWSPSARLPDGKI